MLFGRPASLARFFVRAGVAIFVLTALWVTAARWLAEPAAWLTRFALETTGSRWVKAVQAEPGKLTVDTWVVVRGEADATGRRPVGDLVVDVATYKYGYSLPLLLALLLAAGGRKSWWRLGIGLLLVVAAHAASLYFALLRLAVFGAPGGAAQLGLGPWQVEGIALGYQAGVLLLPTLTPVMVWLWIDREFLASILIDGVLRQRVAPGGDAS